MTRPAAFLALVLAAVAATGCSKKTGPTAPIVVPPLDSIRVTPDTLRVRVGATASFLVVGTDTSGAPFLGVPASWSDDDSLGAIVSIDAQGRVHGLSEGVVHVFATFDSLRDSAVVVVDPQQDAWFAQQSNANGTVLHGVFFLADGRHGWAVGDAGKIVRTVDGGSNWALAVSGSSAALRGVRFTTSSKGWAVGSGGAVLSSVDGGTTWTRVTSNALENLEDVFFATDSVGWVVGANGLVLRTRDAGATWTRTIVSSFTLHSVSFSDTSNGWAVGDNGLIAGTHDGGRTWFTLNPVLTAQALHGVWRRSESLAFAAGEQGVTPRTQRAIADTTRWELRTAGATNQLESVCFPSDATGYAVGFNGVGLILRSDNAALAWRTQTANTQYHLYHVFFVDPLRGWAVGANGTILHTATGGE